MVKQPHERVRGKNVSLYPAQWALVEGWAYDNGFTRSLALRRIIKEWSECKGLDCRLVDTREQYTTEAHNA